MLHLPTICQRSDYVTITDHAAFIMFITEKGVNGDHFDPDSRLKCLTWRKCNFSLHFTRKLEHLVNSSKTRKSIKCIMCNIFQTFTTFTYARTMKSDIASAVITIEE